MRVGELPHQARLAHTWLAHDRDHLTMALACSSEGLLQQLDFCIPAHEARQPSGSGGVQPAPHGARADDLENLDRCGQAFHGHGATRHHLHEPFGEGQRIRGQQDRPRPGDLLHARSQVRRLTDRRVVHVEIRPDGADHHLARVETHADLDRNPVAPEHVLGVTPHRVLHS